MLARLSTRIQPLVRRSPQLNFVRTKTYLSGGNSGKHSGLTNDEKNNLISLAVYSALVYGVIRYIKYCDRRDLNELRHESETNK